MRIQTTLMIVTAAFVALACDPATPTRTDAGAPNSKNGEVKLASAPPVRGYVMARWNDEIPEVEPGECPDGLNVTEFEYYSEIDYEAVQARFEAGDAAGAAAILPPDACQDPLVQPDPGFRTLDGPAIVRGLDLDGVDSQEMAGASCAHNDFAGPDGSSGIDNQTWRLMGCIRGYRPNDLMDRLQKSNASIKEGGYAILLEISGMDDPRNDDAVEVQLISANAPVRMDAVGNVMQHVSLTAHENSRYHNPAARGRIVDGILTTEPVDLRIKAKRQTMDNEYWYRDARIRAEVFEDGSIRGIVGGYQDIKNMFSVLNEHHLGEFHLGRSAAFNRGFMCSGIYHAMPRVADGHPDPETGECTSISFAVNFEAVPAFVIRPQVAMAD